jgi:Raf kinase inhibitor-like YbhB/YbcL family protein
MSSTTASTEFRITSPAFKDGGTLPDEQVYDGFGLKGANISPELNWTGVPEGTKSFALTCYDPAAPTGSGWWHWVVYDIPAGATKLPKGAGDISGKGLPTGAIQARNDYSTKAFGGAAPPEGDAPHPYIFTLYALSIDKLPAPEDASPALIGFLIHFNNLGKAQLTASYGR